MVNFSKTKQLHIAYNKSAVDPKTIEKNGASLKSLTSRGNFLMIFFVIAILCCGLGCKKDKPSDNPKFTDEQIETLYQEIKVVADAVLLSDNPDWNSVVKQYEGREEIKEIEASSNGLMIEFENETVRGWLIPSPSIEWDMGKMRNIASAVPKRTTSGEPPKMLIVNAAYRENNPEVNHVVDTLSFIFKDWNIAIKKEQTNIKFFEKELAGYDVVFIMAHGCAGLDRTWIVTSEKISGITVGKPIFNVLGFGQNIWEYYAVSNNHINANYSNGSFPNTIVYMVCCEGLKNKTHLGEAFVNKGAKVVVGWNESNSLGHYSGCFLLGYMLSEKCSLNEGIEFLKTYTYKIGNSTITDFTYDDGASLKPPQPLNAHLTFYPSTAGNYKLPFPHLVTFTISEATAVSQNSATFNASVTANESNITVTEKGICYSSQNDPPTTADSTIPKGSGTGSYSATLTGLTANKPYFVRPYAVVDGETYYGEKRTFETLQGSGNEESVVINGVRWATRNVDKPGTFTVTPELSGMFYQWNRKVGWTTTDPIINSNGGTTWDSSYPVGSTWEKVNDPSPPGYRVPTKEEIEKLLDETKVTYTKVGALDIENGVPCRRFTDKTTNNSIFLPATGGREPNNGTLYNVGTNAGYWSSAQVIGGISYYFGFYNSNMGLGYLESTYGFSVRPVAE